MDPGAREQEEPPVVNARARRLAAWGVSARGFDRWPSTLAVLAVITLYVSLPRHLYYGPAWLLPAVEGALFIALVTARQIEDEGYEWQRGIAIALTAGVSLANLGSLGLLVHSLLSNSRIHGVPITATNLVIWSAQIWLTNVIVFGLWYWELDRGGPVARCHPRHPPPDFLFPQMSNPESAPTDWNPSFFDYIYTSYTNAAAFSPTDTMPLSEWAKLLFMIQSGASLAMAVLVIARIANILP